MKNLVVDMKQKLPAYNVNPQHFRIDIYIAHDKTVVVIADKDNNYTEWLSIGRLSSSDNSVGKCVNYLLKHSPLPTSTSSTWKSYEEMTGRKFEDLFVFYLGLGAKREGNHSFRLNGERIGRDVSAEYIQHRLIQCYEDYRRECIVFDDIATVREQLQSVLVEIKTMEQGCPFPWALNHVSDHAKNMFDAYKKQYSFCQDEAVRLLLFEFYRLKSDIYNKYMTAVR